MKTYFWRPKRRRLNNQRGVIHHAIPVALAFVILFGAIGTYLFMYSNAATPTTTTPNTTENATDTIGASAISDATEASVSSCGSGVHAGVSRSKCIAQAYADSMWNMSDKDHYIDKGGYNLQPEGKYASNWQCLDALWTHESSWEWNATAPSTGAYGIPQSLPPDKMASQGANWRNNVKIQIRWGLGYIQEIYGNPCGAWRHEVKNNWYGVNVEANGTMQEF